MPVSKKIIDAHIRVIGKGERTFKEEMSALSREMLPYVMEGGDIDAVNRLLDVLTPKNHDLAAKYFSKLLPWKLDNTTKRFGGKSTNKDMVNKRKEAIETFLADETNNIFTWSAANNQSQQREQRPKNYATQISNLVEKALTETKEADRIDVKEVFKSAVKAAIAGGMKLADLMETFDAAVKESEEEINSLLHDEPGNTEAANDATETPAPRKKAA